MTGSRAQTLWNLGGHGRGLTFILRPVEGKLLKDSKQECDIIRFGFCKDTWAAMRYVFWREVRRDAGHQSEGFCTIQVMGVGLSSGDGGGCGFQRYSSHQAQGLGMHRVSGVGRRQCQG